MIKAINLSKSYGSRKAIDNLNFTIEKGKVTGFLGPNGAGKSTVMNIITGYISASSGQVLVNNLDILEAPLEVKRQIGYLPEQPPLYYDLTVDEYINVVARLKKVDHTQLKRDREKIYDLVKIADVRHRLIKNLSKGYKQRVGLASTLISSPPLLILDEPTVGFDPQQILEIRKLISMLQQEHTIVLSSHILSEVQAVCDEALIINKGQVIAYDTPANLAKKMLGGNRVQIKVLASEQQVLKVFNNLPHIKDIRQENSDEEGTVVFTLYAEEETDIRAQVFTALAQAGLVALSLKTNDLNLEEIFLALTTKEGS